MSSPDEGSYEWAMRARRAGWAISRQERRATVWYLALLLIMGAPSLPHAAARPQSFHGVSTVAAVALTFELDVRRAVLLELGADRHLDHSGIEVAVENGIVVLTGSIPLPSWRERAARVAGLVHGVRAVVNRIRVVPVSRPDRAVADEVRRALRGTAALAKMPITVRVQRGVVELTGAISTWEQQQLAERVARHVPGVRFCLNQLTSNASIRRTPAIIASDIRSRLDWDPLVQHDPIRVSVRGGRVFLAGTTGSSAERRRAIDLAWVKGVVAVEAKALLIDVIERPAPNVRLNFPTDSDIVATIQDLARYWPAVPMSALSVSVASGIATVRGNVPTFAEKRAVETIVRSAVGVVEVNNDLRGPWWTPPPRPSPPPPVHKRPKKRRR